MLRSSASRKAWTLFSTPGVLGVSAFFATATMLPGAEPSFHRGMVGEADRQLALAHVARLGRPGGLGLDDQQVACEQMVDTDRLAR